MKKTYSNLVIVVIFIILGYVFTIQMKTPQEDYSFVSLKTMSDLQNQINKEQTELQNMQQLILINNKRLIEYEKAVQRGGSIKDVLYEEINELKILSGFLDLEGEGIIVKLNDSERELYEFEDPNDLVVHEEDVLIILNELRFAGAEAISINGQRILSNTGIKCAGATITINEYTYGQPFIIKAIGNTVTLDAAVKSQGSHAYKLKEVYGLVVDTQVSPRVRIPRFQGSLGMNYVKLREDE